MELKSSEKIRMWLVIIPEPYLSSGFNRHFRNLTREALMRIERFFSRVAPVVFSSAARAPRGQPANKFAGKNIYISISNS